MVKSFSRGTVPQEPRAISERNFRKQNFRVRPHPSVKVLYASQNRKLTKNGKWISGATMVSFSKKILTIITFLVF